MTEKVCPGFLGKIFGDHDPALLDACAEVAKMNEFDIQAKNQECITDDAMRGVSADIIGNLAEEIAPKSGETIEGLTKQLLDHRFDSPICNAAKEAYCSDASNNKFLAFPKGIETKGQYCRH